MNELMILYAIKNNDGQFFRAKGFRGYGDSWVASLGDAKLYSKISQARSRVTWFSKHHPGFPTAEIVELIVTEIRVKDESERVAKVKEAMERRKKKEDESRNKWRNGERDQVRADFQRTKRKLEQMGERC